MNKSLRLIETLRVAISHLWAERKIIGGLLAIVVSIDVALELLQPTFGDENKETGWFVFVFALSLQAFVYTWFAVRVHRLIIGVANPIQGTFTWKGREARFFAGLGASVLFLFIVGFLMAGIVLGAVAVVAPRDLSENWVAFFSVLAFMPAAYLLARLIVLLPAIAIDRKQSVQSVQWALRLTQGYGWRLMLLLWGLPALLYSMFMVFPLDIWLDSLFGILFLNLLYGITTSIEVAVLSITFKVLGGLVEPCHEQTVPQQ